MANRGVMGAVIHPPKAKVDPQPAEPELQSTPCMSTITHSTSHLLNKRFARIVG